MGKRGIWKQKALMQITETRVKAGGKGGRESMKEARRPERLKK